MKYSNIKYYLIPRSTRRHVVMGMVTRLRSSTSLNLTVSCSMPELVTDRPDLQILVLRLEMTSLTVITVSPPGVLAGDPLQVAS